MKKLFGAIVVGTLVFGAVMASAAALTVNGGTIQVGTNGTTLACDTDGVTVGWNTNTQGIVTSAQVTGISTNCIGQHLYLYALDTAGLIVGMPHSPSVDCGSPGTPIAFAPQLLGAAETGAGFAKIALGFVNPRDDSLSAATYPCGVYGALIDGVRVVIGV